MMKTFTNDVGKSSDIGQYGAVPSPLPLGSDIWRDGYIMYTEIQNCHTTDYDKGEGTAVRLEFHHLVEFSTV